MWFADEMIKIENEIKLFFDETKLHLSMSEKGEHQFEKATKC